MRTPWTPVSLSWTPPLTPSDYDPSLSPSGTPSNTLSTAASSGVQLQSGQRYIRGVGPEGERRAPPLGYRRLIRHELRVLQEFYAELEPTKSPLYTDTAVENWYWSWAITNFNKVRYQHWSEFIVSHSTSEEMILRDQSIAEYENKREKQPLHEATWKRLTRNGEVSYT